jgi:hypothetical protein
MSAGVAEAEADIVIGGTVNSVDGLDPMAVDLISILPKCCATSRLVYESRRFHRLGQENKVACSISSEILLSLAGTPLLLRVTLQPEARCQISDL